MFKRSSEEPEAWANEKVQHCRRYGDERSEDRDEGVQNRKPTIKTREENQEGRQEHKALITVLCDRHERNKEKVISSANIVPLWYSHS